MGIFTKIAERSRRKKFIFDGEPGIYSPVSPTSRRLSERSSPKLVDDVCEEDSREKLVVRDKNVKVQHPEDTASKLANRDFTIGKVADIPDEDEETEEEEFDTGYIMVGIDFGTTYSGVAWAYSKDHEVIKIITDWDSTEFQNTDKGKAPTRVAYGNQDGTSPCNTTWGYDVGDADAVEWFKLLLLDDNDLGAERRNSPQIKKAKELLERAGKSPVEAVSDYLRLLWDHALVNIKKDFGEAIDGVPFQVVCTVPAVWTERAVERMRLAAKNAGILSDRLAGETTLRFVSEPEAAALATFDDLKNRPNFQKGDVFVVCDAGGGTVDLISYKVLQTKPLVLEECVEGKGRLCGAVFLDQDFKELMQQFMGEAWNVPASVLNSMLNSQWENGIKRGFEGVGQGRTWQIRVPHECVKMGARPIIDLEEGYVSEIFDNVVSQIRSLVNEQISAIQDKEHKLPVAIVLVGGFGSCRFVYNQLNLENRHRGIEVFQSAGTRPWTAICRGAVLRALTNSSLPGIRVQSRIVRYNYGTGFMTKFDPTVHAECDKFFDGVKGELYATNQMKWYLKRGENISETKVLSHRWEHMVDVEHHGESYTLSASIYTCASHEPPSRISRSVEKNFKFMATNPIDISTLEKCKGSDGRYYKTVKFELTMTVIGAALDFALLYKGERVGHQQTQVEVDTIMIR